MTRSPTWIEPFSLNGVDGLTSPDSSTPPTVTTLNVEPGSYVSVTARLRRRSSSQRETIG